MAEAMINDRYRESLQSLDKLVLDAPASQQPHHHTGSPKEEKRVKHGPTTVIQIPDKRRKVSTSVTAKNVMECKCIGVVSSDSRSDPTV